MNDERFDLIIDKINMKIADSKNNLDKLGNDPAAQIDYFYNLGRFHAYNEDKLMIVRQIKDAENEC